MAHSGARLLSSGQLVGVAKKITKAAQKLKPCFRSHYDSSGSLRVYCDFIGIKTHYGVRELKTGGVACRRRRCDRLVRER
jgi:hypothetical protein